MEKELPLVDAGVDACGCGHDHGDREHEHHHRELQQDPDLAIFEAMFIEIAYGLQERFGDHMPTPDEEKEFMREWLLTNRRTAEQADAILNTP